VDNVLFRCMEEVSMKKIAFLSHLDANLYLFRLPIMIELVKLGYKVYAICPRGDKFDKFEQYGVEAIEYKIERSSLNPLKEFITIKRIYDVIKPLDLDILQNFTAKPNIYGSIVGKIAKVPLVGNAITGLGSFYLSDSFKSKFIRFIMERLYKIANSQVDFVIFQNGDDRDYFIDKKLVDKEKSILIRSSGIDTQKFAPIDIEHKKLRVLMIARAIWHKGIREFYTMADNLKNLDVEFVLIGDTDNGNPSCADEDFLKNSNVKWLGHRDDIKEQIAKCDIFVLPSYREGVPRTLLEASSMAKPIVTTDTVGCKEVVIDGYNGFLVPLKDTKILTEKVKELIFNKKLRNTMGKNGRIITLKEFDVRIVVKKYVQIYKKSI